MISLPSASALYNYDPIWLLWCKEPYAKPSIEEVSKALLQSADPEGEICTLLSEADWRSHLIAGVALAISEHGTKPKLVQALWSALDVGSWVSPQLAVCLECIDPDFSLQAKSRIESGCPLVARPSSTSAKAAPTQPVEQGPAGLISRCFRTIATLLKRQALPPLGEEMARRHVEQGPDGPIERSAKTMAALVYLCSLRPECETWLNRWLAESSTQRLLAVDRHKGDEIAKFWRTQFSNASFAFRSG